MAERGLAALDRKAMEEDRLARLAKKRAQSISPPPLRAADNKAPKLEEETISLPSGARLTSFSTLVDNEQRGRKSDSANAATQHLNPGLPHVKAEQDTGHATSNSPPVGMQPGLQYPSGVVKRTWAFGHERQGDDVKLEEVLEPRTLRTAVLSAFQWNTDWVLSKLKIPPNGGQTKCVFIMQAKEDSLRREMIDQTKHMSSFLRLCMPSMVGQINCMHSKLMLLFHPDKLRIAIPTANLLDFDWGETGTMENSVFMIDLPRLPTDKKAERKTPNAFCAELLYFLKKQSVDQDIMDGVLNFDFSATDSMIFVHTVGGSNMGKDGERTGLPGLASAVRQLNLQAKGGLEIDFAASSIGSLNDDQLRNLHAAARGEDMIKRASGAATNAQAEFFKASSSKTSSRPVSIRDKIRIYFPTHDTVRSSKAGATGTICLSRKWWEEMRFPRSCFRDYRSTRAGLLSHNKILYARGKQLDSADEDKDVAWAYVGSANMSESAWGKVVHDKKAKAWKVNCRNWECGVLLPVDRTVLGTTVKKGKKTTVKQEKFDGEDSETESEDESGATGAASAIESLVDMAVFDGVVRPPFMMPGQTFGDREPWYFQEFS